MIRFGWTGVAGIAALLLACGGEPEREATSSVVDAIALFDGGKISLAEVEKRVATARTPACRVARWTGDGGSLEQLIPCYREVSEALALERLALAETPDIDRAIEGLGERYFELRRQAFLNPYYRRLREEIETSDEETETYFEENRQDFRRPPQRTLWNIFRRHQDPTRPEETKVFLAGLKERHLSGEPFSSLARQHSQSETRLRDGLVGPVTEGKLPPRLEEIVFALDEGEVSDPVWVRGGAVLLHVRNIVDGVDPGLEGVRENIRRQLMLRKIEERVAQKVAGHEPPADSVVLDQKELLAALDGEDSSHTVLEMAGQRLTSGQLRQLSGLSAPDRTSDLDDEERDQLLEVYRRQTEQQLLLVDLLESGDPDLRREAEAHLREQGLPELVDQNLQNEMWKRIDSDPEQLRQYYEDNLTTYQNPLRFKLVAWDLPFDDDPPRQLERMEKLHGALSAGEINLAAAAERLGGSVRELGWRDFEDLTDEIPNKARAYLLAGEGTFSVPYQQDDALHLLQVEEREEPQPLKYEEVAEQVREDYLERFQQRLYRKVAEMRLADAGFLFDEDEARRLLSRPTEARPAEAESSS